MYHTTQIPHCTQHKLHTGHNTNSKTEHSTPKPHITYCTLYAAAFTIVNSATKVLNFCYNKKKNKIVFFFCWFFLKVDKATQVRRWNQRWNFHKTLVLFWMGASLTDLAQMHLNFAAFFSFVASSFGSKGNGCMWKASHE